MSNAALSRADPVVVFPLSRWCPPQGTSQPHSSNCFKEICTRFVGNIGSCTVGLGYTLQWSHTECNASQITCVPPVFSTVCSGADQRKCQSSASLAFARGIHRWPTNSPHRGLVMRKMFPFDDVTMSDVLRPKQDGTLQSRHNGHLGVSTHQPHHCLLNRLFWRRSKKNIKAPRHWPLWGEFTSDLWIPHRKGQ